MIHLPRTARHLPLVLVLAVSACDTDSASGSYDATVSGSVTADLSGDASFRDGLIYLAYAPGSIQITTPDAEVAPGTYVVDAEARGDRVAGAVGVRFEYVPPGSSVPDDYTGISGEVVIESVSSDDVAGRFVFVGQGFNDPSRSVEVQGRFEAARVSFDDY